MSKRNDYQAWAPADDATLTRLHGEGFCFREIGRAMGRSYSAINGRCVRIGLTGVEKPVYSSKDRYHGRRYEDVGMRQA